MASSRLLVAASKHVNAGVQPSLVQNSRSHPKNTQAKETSLLHVSASRMAQWLVVLLLPLPRSRYITTLQRGTGDRRERVVPRGTSGGDPVRVRAVRPPRPHVEMKRAPLGIPLAQKWPSARIMRKCGNTDTEGVAIQTRSNRAREGEPLLSDDFVPGPGGGLTSPLSTEEHISVYVTGLAVC
jgi:hypothetical protein